MNVVQPQSRQPQGLEASPMGRHGQHTAALHQAKLVVVPRWCQFYGVPMLGFKGSTRDKGWRGPEKWPNFHDIMGIYGK